MEVQSPAVKRHYDITMSRRTRKQASMPIQGNEKSKSMVDDVTTKVETSKKITSTSVIKEGDENGHKSLKQLIIRDDNKDEKKGSVGNDERGKGSSRNSLGEHFTEEEKQHLQLVRMQQKDNLQGLKFKKLVRRYAKVLGHLMKAKRDPHLGDATKKPVFKLSS